jgi:hypothetical protein
MKLHLICISVLFAISCKVNTDEWQTLDFRTFRLKAPQGWKIIKEEGIDSYVGGLTNGKDTLWFDFGMYRVDLGGEDTITHKFARDTINGLYARVTIPEHVGHGYISVHIPKVDQQNQFTIWGKDILASDTVLKMLKSLVFKQSDTTVNPPLKEDRFIVLSHGSGKSIYFKNCASCHAIRKVALGPPMQDLLNLRGAEWIYKFITDRPSVGNDTTHLKLRRKYDSDCMQFPWLTKQDVELLVDFIASN